ncbi:hypothetical protein IE53DRAFT_273428 [Violaceomyces palustris]|uniref:Uncharacterized protein n=1 Tax=Violaceomyces palustris TaxID=1673888 RepID=A0ACD0P365_9BASI|nr:hypothetical protein IE53DRAFT_273428 [Violaceomyces palustris]
MSDQNEERVRTAEHAIVESGQSQNRLPTLAHGADIHFERSQPILTASHSSRIATPLSSHPHPSPSATSRLVFQSDFKLEATFMESILFLLFKPVDVEPVTRAQVKITVTLEAFSSPSLAPSTFTFVIHYAIRVHGGCSITYSSFFPSSLLPLSQAKSHSPTRQPSDHPSSRASPQDQRQKVDPDPPSVLPNPAEPLSLPFRTAQRVQSARLPYTFQKIWLSNEPDIY